MLPYRGKHTPKLSRTTMVIVALLVIAAAAFVIARTALQAFLAGPIYVTSGCLTVIAALIIAIRITFAVDSA